MLIPKIFSLHSVIQIFLLKYGNIYHCENSYKHNESITLTIQMSKVCFGYEKSILEYFTCKHNILVKVDAVQDIELNDVDTISMGLSKTDQDDAEKFHVTSLQQIYLVELITGLRPSLNQAYLSFKSSFDNNIWLLLLFSSISLSILVTIIIKDINKSSEVIISPLIYQGSNYLKSLAFLSKLNCPRKFSIIVLLTLWLNSVSILINAFNGLLLNTYFNVNTLPVVNSLLDIYHKKELLVVGNPFHVQLLSETKAIEQDQLDDIVNRMMEFINDTDFDYDTQMFNGHVFMAVVTGRVVIVCDSLVSDSYLRNFHKWQEHFTVLEQKYLPDYANLLVHKTNSNAQLVHSLYTQVMENGLHIHRDLIFNLLQDYLSKRGSNGLDQFHIHKSVHKSIVLDECFRNSIVLLIPGYLLSIVSLFFEYFVKK